jgi:hypothetical protein
VLDEMCCTWWVTGAGADSSAATAGLVPTAGAASRAPARDRRASWLRGLLGVWWAGTAAVGALALVAAPAAARLRLRGVGAMLSGLLALLV